MYVYAVWQSWSLAIGTRHSNCVQLLSWQPHTKATTHRIGRHTCLSCWSRLRQHTPQLPKVACIKSTLTLAHKYQFENDAQKLHKVLRWHIFDFLIWKIIVSMCKCLHTPHILKIVSNTESSTVTTTYTRDMFLQGCTDWYVHILPCLPWTQQSTRVVSHLWAKLV